MANNSAFSDEFRKRLSLGKYTQWAEDLTEDQLEVVLWHVGELGLRPVPGLREGSTAVWHYRSLGAVRVLKRYVFGGRLSMRQAFDWVHRGIEPPRFPKGDQSK